MENKKNSNYKIVFASVLALAVLLGSFHFISCQSKKQLSSSSDNYFKTFLPTGGTAHFRKDSRLPLINISLVLKSGLAYEADSQPAGVSEVVAYMLKRGTANYTAQKIAEKIDSLASDVSVNTGTYFVTLSMEVLSVDFSEALDFLFELAFNPDFSSSELAGQKRLWEASLKTQPFESPDKFSDYIFESEFFKGSVYSKSGVKLSSLPKISLAHLKNYHSKNYKLARSDILISGDFSDDDIGKVQDLVADYAQKSQEEASFVGSIQADPALPSKSQVVFLENNSLDQTYLVYGYEGQKTCDLSRINSRMANYFFGGSSSNQAELYKSLREERGLTYGAYAHLDHKKEVGAFKVTTSTNHKNITQVLDLIESGHQKFAKRSFTDEDLETVRSQLYSRLASALKVSAKTRLAVDYRASDKGCPSLVENLFERIETASLSDLSEGLKFFENDKSRLIVIYGSSSQRKALKAWAESKKYLFKAYNQAQWKNKWL